MSAEERAKEIIADVSSQDLDQWVRTDSFTTEIEEVGILPRNIISEKGCEKLQRLTFFQSVRGHIHQELTSWLFFRKMAADCSRSNISLHGFARSVYIAFILRYLFVQIF